MGLCDLSKCEARCCYDGVYLTAEDEKRIAEAREISPTLFSFLPTNPVVKSSWQGHEPGRKTATKPWTYLAEDFPDHFTKTRCVFALDDGRCSLQVLAVTRSEHPWTYKPTACWLHPLKATQNKLIPPPVAQAEDPDAQEGYPGYVTYTPCGQLEETKPWRETFSAEVQFYELRKPSK